MKLCRTRLILLVLAFPLVLRAQNSIVERLDAKERQLEGLYAEYWRTEYQIALDNEHPSSRSIQEKIRAVTRDKQFLDDLKAAHFRDPVLNRRRSLFLEEAAYTEISNDEKVTAAVEEITHRENTIRYRVGNRELTRAQLTDLLTHDPDRQVRRQAWEARAQITSGNGEPLRAVFKMRNILALQHTNELFSTFMLRRKGVETQRLFEWFDAIRSQTETQYQQLLERMRCELKIGRVEPWDLEFYFSTRTNDFEKKRFVPDQGWTKTEQLAGSLGYDLNKLPVQMLTADLSFAGAAYPILYGREVKILANRYSGIFFFDRLFHAAGHALHYSMMNESSFLLRANYAEPFDEGLAQVIALMLYRPEVNGELFDLTPEESEIVAETYRFKEMFDLRSTMADSLFEFEAYAEPEQDLAALYNRIHSQYLGVDMHGAPVWAYNPMYGSDPIFLQSYVVGEIVARQIGHKIDQKFARHWNTEAGTYLRARFYSRGASKPLDGLMQDGTGEPLTARYLIEYLRKEGSTRPQSK